MVKEKEVPACRLYLTYKPLNWEYLKAMKKRSQGVRNISQLQPYFGDNLLLSDGSIRKKRFWERVGGLEQLFGHISGIEHLALEINLFDPLTQEFSILQLNYFDDEGNLRLGLNGYNPLFPNSELNQLIEVTRIAREYDWKN